jgi:hypothetical protein
MAGFLAEWKYVTLPCPRGMEMRFLFVDQQAAAATRRVRPRNPRDTIARKESE